MLNISWNNNELIVIRYFRCVYYLLLRHALNLWSFVKRICWKLRDISSDYSSRNAIISYVYFNKQLKTR